MTPTAKFCPRGIPALAVALAFLCALAAASVIRDEKSADENNDIPEYPDYEQKVMPKRSALLLDRMFVALQKALENDEMGKDGYKSLVRSYPYYSDMSDSPGMGLSDEKTMDLQRRGQAKGRVYWRCYFNAVSCFKRK